jgi:hypothetical protein
VAQETWLCETVVIILKTCISACLTLLFLSHFILYLRQFHDRSKFIKQGNSWGANKQPLGWRWNCPPFIQPECSVLWVVRLRSSGTWNHLPRKDKPAASNIALNVEVMGKVIPVHAIKAYRRRRRMAPHILSVNTRRRWVVTSRPRHFTHRKQARLPFSRKSGGSQSQYKRKQNRNLLPLLGFETRNVQSVV